MNKIIKVNGSSLIVFNTETQEVKELNGVYARIDYTYIIEEDCVIEIDGVDVNLEKDDIIFKMYSNAINNRDYIVVKNEKLVEHMRFLDENKNSKYEEPVSDLCCEKSSN